MMKNMINSFGRGFFNSFGRFAFWTALGLAFYQLSKNPDFMKWLTQ